MRFLPAAVLILAVLSCARSSEPGGMQVNLPPIPETVLTEIESKAAQGIWQELEVPELFEPEEWNLAQTGRRMMKLLAEGVQKGRLKPRQAELLEEMSKYLFTFQLDEVEENFVLSCAALALVGIEHSSPTNLDHRYRMGLSRMWFWYLETTAPKPYMKDLVNYVIEAALFSELPLLQEILEYYISAVKSLPEDTKVFRMEGTDEHFLQGFNLPGQAGEELQHALAENDLELAKKTVALYYAEKFSILRDLAGSSSANRQAIEDILKTPRPDMGQWWDTNNKWRTLTVGQRAANFWPRVLAAGAEDSVLVDELFYPMIRCLYQHGDYLMINLYYHLSNWVQVETSGLLVASLLLPEHEDSKIFRQTALRRFNYFNHAMYFPDGMNTENTYGYHNFALSTQRSAFEVARSVGTELDTAWTGVFERGIEAVVLAAKPDGTLPVLSDANGGHIRDWLNRGRELFPDNPLFRYPLGETDVGDISPPRVTSYFFPYAGYGIMREDWTPQSQYLLFEMGFYGTNHQHEDKLNIILHAYGRELLHDPGIHSYDENNFEHYFRGTRGHNCVLIDGKEQRRDMFFDKANPYAGLSFPDKDSRWFDRPTHILAAGAYRQGFAERIHHLYWRGPRDDEMATLVPVEHERTVLWVKGEYWMVLDYLAGKGEHKLEQVWHFSPIVKAGPAGGVDPGKVVLEGDRVVHSLNPGMANLVILQVGGEDLQARKQKGERDPMVGWTSLSGQSPAWDVTFETRRALPTALATVLLPLRLGESRFPTVQTIRQDAQVAAFDLLFGDHTDRIVLVGSEKGARVEFDGGWYEGRALVLRKVAGGRFELMLHEGGRRLFVDGKEIPLM